MAFQRIFLICLKFVFKPAFLKSPKQLRKHVSSQNGNQQKKRYDHHDHDKHLFGFISRHIQTPLLFFMISNVRTLFSIGNLNRFRLKVFSNNRVWIATKAKNYIDKKFFKVFLLLYPIKTNIIIFVCLNCSYLILIIGRTTNRWMKVY